MIFRSWESANFPSAVGVEPFGVFMKSSPRANLEGRFICELIAGWLKPRTHACL
jgi:hypothetical protein